MFNCMCNKIQLEGAINSPNWQKEMHPLATKYSWLSDSLAFIPNWIMHKSKMFSMAYKCEQSLLFMTSSWYLHTPYTNSNEFRWLSFYTLRVLLLLAMFVGNTCHKEKPIKCQKDKWYHELVLSCNHPKRDSLYCCQNQSVDCLLVESRKFHPNIAMLLQRMVTSHCPSL